MNQLSADAFAAYRRLLDEPGFVTYFRSASPIDQIGHMNIGSRPVKRKATRGIQDLRAIPWVFAWTQNRHTVSAWYGAGTALETAIADSARRARLQEM